MSSLVLKLIAMVTMFTDHLTASCFYHWGIGNIWIDFLGMSLYTLGRTIGRIAFPIYCFLIVEGVYHTRSRTKYALRLAVMALVSEFAFDFGLHALRVQPGSPEAWQRMLQSIDWGHQNVFFTLLLGMLVVAFLRGSREWILQTAKEKTALRTCLWLLRYLCYAALACGVGCVAKFVLHTDYGMGGVVMISIMGLIYEYWEDWLPFLPVQIIRVVICGLGLWACCEILNSSIEYYGMLALIPIGLYNGKKGYANRPLQYGFYLFYPLHLIVVGILSRIG